jgi:hypothetical protein
MATLLGNFLLGLVDEISDSIQESRRESAEADYQWAADRAQQSYDKYELHARRHNYWLSEVERLERECHQLEQWLRDPRATSSDSARYRVLYNELRRARHYAEEERRDARSAEREFRMREEVAVKRSSFRW